jgi:hypothetical protein
MRTRCIPLILAALAVTVLAGPIGPPYNDATPPKLSLPAAYDLARVALGSATNQFHCTKASITTDFGVPRWSFDFYTTNAPPRKRCMTVDFEGKVQEDGGFR